MKSQLLADSLQLQRIFWRVGISSIGVKEFSHKVELMIDNYIRYQDTTNSFNCHYRR